MSKEFDNSNEVKKAVQEILLTDAEGGPIDVWDYDQSKLIKRAKELVQIRKTGVIGETTLRKYFTPEFGRENLLYFW